MLLEAAFVFLSSDLKVRNLCSHDGDFFRIRCSVGMGNISCGRGEERTGWEGIRSSKVVDSKRIVLTIFNTISCST